MIPSHYVKTCNEVYRPFAKKSNCELDFSDKAMKECFDYESKGIGDLELGNIFNDKKVFNGFYIGKRLMDITVGMWKEDLGDTLFLEELYDDWYPHWWLDKVFGKEKCYADAR